MKLELVLTKLGKLLHSVLLKYHGNVLKQDILYLPETELTDEELLEIIDYEAKLTYALYETEKEALFGEENYENRLKSMTDEEVNYYYLAMYSNKMDVCDALCRGSFDPHGPSALTESEKVRYPELEKEYKEKKNKTEEAVNA